MQITSEGHAVQAVSLLRTEVMRERMQGGKQVAGLIRLDVPAVPKDSQEFKAGVVQGALDCCGKQRAQTRDTTYQLRTAEFIVALMKLRGKYNNPPLPFSVIATEMRRLVLNPPNARQLQKIWTDEFYTFRVYASMWCPPRPGDVNYNAIIHG